jgi:CheY-like chemotaxis protein
MPPRNAHAARPANILLVDDNTHGLSARRAVLSELGHTIVTAQSGAAALEKFSAQQFDLVVTDYKMPKMDGLELVARLKKLAPSLPVVLISGFVDALGLNEKSTGADVVIQKSNNEVSHLVRAIQRLLGGNQAPPKPARKPSGGAGPAASAKVRKQSA